MNSIYLKHKTKKQIEEFVSENQFVYPINLQRFLGCTYRTSERIIKKVKDKYKITSKYLPSNIFFQYVYEEI